jgi:hypothetical protein
MFRATQFACFVCRLVMAVVAGVLAAALLVHPASIGAILVGAAAAAALWRLA